MGLIKTGCLDKVVACVFTSVVAPVLVHVLVQDLTASPSPSAGSSCPARVVGPAARDVWVGKGVGPSPADARRAALHDALRKAVHFISSQTVTPAQCQALCEGLIRDPGTVFRYEERACTWEVQQNCPRYAEEVTVDVDRRRLCARLETAALHLRN